MQGTFGRNVLRIYDLLNETKQQIKNEYTKPPCHGSIKYDTEVGSYDTEYLLFYDHASTAIKKTNDSEIKIQTWNICCQLFIFLQSVQNNFVLTNIQTPGKRCAVTSSKV